MHRALAVLLASSLALTTAVAQAEDIAPPASSTPAPASTVDHWYGWQLLAVDVVSVGAYGTAYGASRAGGSFGSEAAAPAVMLGGVATFLFAPPILHAVRHQSGHAAISFLLRLGLAGGGAAIGAAIGSAAAPSYTLEEHQPTNFAGFDGAILGSAIGAVTAAVIDDGFVAHEQVPVEHADRAVSVSATFAPVRGGATAGIGGTF